MHSGNVGAVGSEKAIVVHPSLWKGICQEQMYRFVTLPLSLENEQRQLKANIPEMKNNLTASQGKGMDLQRFIEQTK